MRRLAQFTEFSELAPLAFYLQKKGIQVQISRDDQEKSLDLWILDEDAVEAAWKIFQEYKTNPDAPHFATPHDFTEAEVLKSTEQKSPPPFPPRGRRPRTVNVRDELFSNNLTSARVTMALIALSVIATYVIDGPAFEWLKIKLFYSEYMGRSFPEIRNGEIWRIITPIFIHGGFLHLLFNMLWIQQLASQIETLEGSWYLLFQTLLFAAVVNTAQYLVSGPNFVGISGVLYAQLAYTWVMGDYSQKYRYFLAPGTVTMMLVWMAICVVGIIPNVANTQHVGGFIIGYVFGYVRSGEAVRIIKNILKAKR